ncbi:DNA/RNA helicase [Microbacterium mangrovi]|uniref:DNA/RNA helicase n=1 Tax=Microbacterium mangrovi TaxID=1348253 RepID=A0A0B2A3N8_9MICO|nr:DUF559 domain-containing protein [Microbacterium mangrovi]KHK96197.1 DNA/RNA helicase [Microbacterium mangrovi]
MVRQDVPPLVGWLASHRGISHTRHAREAGFDKHVVAAAVASGTVHRIRRSWIALPACDPKLTAAAEVSGRLTCVSAGALHGLWTPQHSGGVHVAITPGSSRLPEGERTLHWARGPVPTSRLAIVDAPLNVLFHIARCLPRADALAVWESAFRRGWVEPEVVRRVTWTSTAARDLASIAGDLSDSGLETRFTLLMRSVGVSVRQQVSIDGHPVDGLIGERLVVQLDGFEFHRAADRRRDLRADARLALRGYTTLRFDYEQIFFESDYVLESVLTAIAQGLHRISR